jgi:hypothetical protein
MAPRPGARSLLAAACRALRPHRQLFSELATTTTPIDAPGDASENA